MRETQMLLDQVSTIKKAYDLVAENTGEKFNLFSILGMESSEVKTHSKFLAELLDVKGSHLRGSLFLDLFMQYCAVKINKKNALGHYFSDLKLGADNSKTAVEYYIGKVEEGTVEYNFDDAKGGRIDILVWNNKYALIIENKIYAGEQDHQLIRYSNFGLKQGFKNYLMIYLTLDGAPPTSCKISDLDKILCLSYKEDIINWLEQCKMEVVDYPTIREGISQYITLLKKLTHQTTNANLSMEVQKIILNNIESAQLIKDNFDNPIYQITSKVRSRVIRKLTAALEGVFDVSEEYVMNNKSGYSPIFLSSSNLPNNVKFAIEGFNYFMTGHKSGALYYGIWSKDAKFEEIDNKLQLDLPPFGWWREILTFHDENAQEIDFSKPDFLTSLNNNPQQIDVLVDVITNEFLSYLRERKNLYHQLS